MKEGRKPEYPEKTPDGELQTTEGQDECYDSILSGNLKVSAF